MSFQKANQQIFSPFNKELKELLSNQINYHLALKDNNSNKIYKITFQDLYNNIKTLLTNEGFDGGGGDSLNYPSSPLILDNEHDIFNLLLIINDNNNGNGVNPINHYISVGDIFNHIHHYVLYPVYEV